MWASDCPPPSGRCATDHGPFIGVFWQRAPIGGPQAWGSYRRLSPPHVHAVRPSIAASDNDVYVTWVRQLSYLHDRPGAARVVWVRASDDQGLTWGSPIALSFRGSRADFPVVAASGGDAWVVWTNAGTGEIRLAATTDGGAHWARSTIGTTTAGAGTLEGRRGLPGIGAAGTDVVVAWIDRPGGRQVALVSHNAGGHWAGPTVLTNASPNDGLHYPIVRGADDGVSDRVAVAYATHTGIDVRTYEGSALGPARTVAGPWTDSPYVGGYGATAAPWGTDGLTVAWSACRRVKSLPPSCHPSHAGARIGLREQESGDDGRTWSPPLVLAAASAGAPVNEVPSVEADGASGLRLFTWLRRSPNWSSYRVWARTASAS